MFIGLQELEVRRVRFDVSVPPGEIDYDDNISQDSTLRAEGTAELISHSLAEIRIKGRLSVTMKAPCDRCLETASVPIEKHFDLVYVPSDEGESHGEKEVDEGAIEVGYYEGGGLTLNEVLREVVLLALPMQVVCSDVCKGICPACGQNRNQLDCGCHPQPVDDRWSKLKSLRAEIGPQN